MFKEEVKIMNVNGLHVRPAARLVKCANAFISDIFISLDGKSVNAKSLFRLQTLSLTYGSVITITAKGKDSKEAVKKIKKLIEEL
ncbi:HPr family phosphocarrier protein [Buchnera aphidicola]|uniref:Phosphocarrier protein HPr n=1 Tax=Buchnera aphidicola (Anoecia oenotherae) TaxID=1241833 RepID=A0A4D6Y010_9GAMM|nr:HPr family phosphocarrier protein [Buchnera aphidicola]QCI19191.1 HPr family phosphocarrier protein [Buchnera aphidicola (Anoecia oenotherae)]